MNNGEVKESLRLGSEKHKKGDLSGAGEIYEGVLALEPGNADAWHLLGVVDHQFGRRKEAIEKITKAIELNPRVGMYYCNLGMVYDSLGNIEFAKRNFEKALSLGEFGNAYLAHYNLGVYCKEEGNFMGALEHYDKSIELNGEFAEACWNRGLVLLLLGRFGEGWKDYEYRFRKKTPSDSRSFHGEKWKGESLEGKKILIVSEQGCGDNIQFVRYLPLVNERGGKVVLECKKELRKLFEGLSGVDEFVNSDLSEIDYDFYIHLMSLPGIFNTDLNSIPGEVPYLKSNSELVEKFKKSFLGDDFKVGIVWAGNPEQENDGNRSASFEKFKSLIGIPGVKLFSLQKGRAVEELNDFSVVDLSEDLGDFSDTAAVIENLDLVISVDTSVAHLAGALGKETWVLLTRVPDWRWGLQGDDCAWYPGMRLFRQKEKGDWDSLVGEVKGELEKVLQVDY
tara:strand:+ start:1791 stop:3146 length:1356 start_codon:yes stop_codon:yes gene_type:complete